MPLGIHVGSKMEITVIIPELISLHELVYSPERLNGSEEGLSLSKKIAVLIELAKLLNQLHSLGTPYAHGNLNSHNVFVELPDNDNEPPIVRIGEIEMSDFKRYANLFFNYRSVSVYSAPECLAQPKKRLDPTPQMDVYSFGVLMWELLYEKEPFDGVLSTAVEYVVKEDARPLIQTADKSKTVDLDEAGDVLLLTEDLANIIRRCWQTDVAERPSLGRVAKELLDQQRHIFQTYDDDEHQLIEQ